MIRSNLAMINFKKHFKQRIKKNIYFSTLITVLECVFYWIILSKITGSNRRNWVTSKQLAFFCVYVMFSVLCLVYFWIKSYKDKKDQAGRRTICCLGIYRKGTWMLIKICCNILMNFPCMLATNYLIFCTILHIFNQVAFNDWLKICITPFAFNTS